MTEAKQSMMTPAAWREFVALRAENARLREALDGITRMKLDPIHPQPGYHVLSCVRAVAERALSPTEAPERGETT